MTSSPGRDRFCFDDDAEVLAQVLRGLRCPRSGFAAMLMTHTAMSWNRSWSSWGTPRISAMICTGKRYVNSRTNSAEPRSTNLSMRSCMIGSTTSDSHPSTPCGGTPRSPDHGCRLCSGSSMPTSTNGPITISMSSRIALDENVTLSRNTCRARSYVYTLHTGLGRAAEVHDIDDLDRRPCAASRRDPGYGSRRSPATVSVNWPMASNESSNASDRGTRGEPCEKLTCVSEYVAGLPAAPRRERAELLVARPSAAAAHRSSGSMRRATRAQRDAVAHLRSRDRRRIGR